MLGIFIDIEATGLDPTQHRVLEIAVKIVDLRDNTIKATYETIVAQPKEVWNASDPESIKVNGFSWEMTKQGKTETETAKEIIALFDEYNINRKHAVFIGQNSSFDRAFFAQLINVYQQEEKNWPYHWLDLASMYWGIRVHNLLKDKKAIPGTISLTKNDIAHRFNIPPEQRPHRAINGVNHLITCYLALVGTSRME